MRSFICTAILAALSIPSLAQNTPKIDIFGGFSYLNYEAASVNLPSGTETINNTCPPASSSTSICISSVTGPSSVNFNPRMGLYGWNGSVTAILTPWFGFTTDVSGNYSTATNSVTTTETVIQTPLCTPNPCSPITSTSTYQYTVSEPLLHHFLFGPQFSFPTRKVRTYAHFLIGGDHESVLRSEFFILNSPASANVGTPATTNSTR